MTQHPSCSVRLHDKALSLGSMRPVVAEDTPEFCGLVGRSTDSELEYVQVTPGVLKSPMIKKSSVGDSSNIFSKLE
ncbi:unnamed protein product [Leptidea sinapis]|uniref:Uncharacterized protein n=1 Tax=Leptidea sinapis TaxID=189913 RepID=A0A5E4QWY9_9NEOP|nr:unnamed protein product [Leptidea sinapis]